MEGLDAHGYASHAVIMARRNEPPPPTPPSIPLEEGKLRLETMKEKAEVLLKNGRVEDDVLETWTDTTIAYIKQTFGSNTPHVGTFCGPVAIRMGSGFGDDYADYSAQNARDMQRRIKVLEQLREIIETEIKFAARSQAPAQAPDFWSHLHPAVVQHAKARYEAGHLADAVEAAFKHLNATVKALVLKKTGKELDGASLMKHAFSPNAPVLVLDDLSTETGRSIQLGYMELFSGSMSGIRNPKAHDNIHIDEKRAMHLLFLASLLFYKLDERI